MITIVKDSNGIEYKQAEDGTCYDINTKYFMIDLIQRLKSSQERVRLHLGDTQGDTAGRDWMDCFDVEGRLSRSTGDLKVPILLHNARSTGGGSVLTANIVKITATKGKWVIYQHPNYHTPKTPKKQAPVFGKL